MTRQAILIAFALWVMNADQPPYQRATFSTYADCVIAGQAEVDSLRPLAPDVKWQCLPDGNG
jgi:hypothetical protein